MGAIHPGLPDDTFLSMTPEAQDTALRAVADYYKSEPRLADGTPVTLVRAGVINTPTATAFNDLEAQVKAANERAAAAEARLNQNSSSNQAVVTALQQQAAMAERTAELANKTLSEKTAEMRAKAEADSSAFMAEAERIISEQQEKAAAQTAKLAATIKDSWQMRDVAANAPVSVPAPAVPEKDNTALVLTALSIAVSLLR